MGELVKQLRLCLWKHAKLRQRQPVTTLFQLFFPAILILMLVLLKIAMPGDNFETCQFRARTGPSAGPLSMLQSFACNIQNNCGKMKDFEDVPTYPGSKLDIIVKYMEPVLYNTTVQEFSSNIPNSLRLVNSTAEALNNSIVMEKFAEEVQVSDMFYDPTSIQQLLVTAGFDPTTAEVFMEATVRVGMLSGDIASIGSFMNTLDCSEATVQMLLPTADNGLISSLQDHICSSDENKKDFFKVIQKNIDYQFFQQYFQDLSTQDPSKVLESVVSGFSLLSDLSTILNPTQRRKRQTEDMMNEFSAFLTDMSETVETLSSLYDQEKAECILSSLSREGNIVEKMNSCNMTELIDPVYDMLKVQLPIWKKALDLVPAQLSSQYEAYARCEVDVNRLMYLSEKASDGFPDDLVRCASSMKREALDYQELISGLDVGIIQENLENWRKEEFASMEWTDEAKSRMTNILDHLSKVTTSLQNIPFDELAEASLTDPVMLQVLLSSKASLILTSLTAAVNESEYFFKNSPVWDNYTDVIQSLENAKQLMGNNIIQVKDFTANWTNIETHLKSNSNLSHTMITDLNEEVFSLDMIAIAWLNMNNSLGSFCNATVLDRYLHFNSDKLPIGITILNIAEKLCASSEILPDVMKGLRIDDLLDLTKFSIEISPESLSMAANITQEEFDETVQALWDFSSIFEDLESSVEMMINEINITDVKRKLNVSEINEQALPQLVSNFLCGEPLEPMHELPYKPLEPIHNDNITSGYLPLQNNCSIVSDYLTSTWQGRVVWRYLAPIMSGNIYMSPNNTLAKSVIEKAQPFFDSIQQFRSNVSNIANKYEYLQYMESYRPQVKILSSLMTSKFFDDFKQSKFGEEYNMTNIEVQNLTANLESIIKIKDMFKFGSKMSQGLECINTNRFILLENELSILETAKDEKNDFLAGVVFLDQEAASTTTENIRRKRANENYNEELRSIQYKIRMEIDSVPITSAIKERLWVPGPDGDFYYNMRYFWGFTQIQDLIDTSIIEMLTDKKLPDKVLMQQFPYPCFFRDNYLSGIYTAQLLQVSLIFGYAVLVSTFVREYVWERESKNGQIIQVMGMKSAVIWTSNLIVMFIVFMFNALLITIILSFGEILPKTLFAIIFLTFLVYSLALIAFIYMMTMFLSKSTSGSVTTFLIYIVTFIPFLIMISLNQDVDSVVKLATAPFMTTCFGFSILYITRYEQQQLGLTWDNIAQSPMEGDTFSFVHYLIFTLMDAMLYWIVGFIVSKFSNIDGSWYKGKNNTSHQKSERDVEEDSEGIQVISLTKEYRLGRKNKRIAVDNLNLHFKKNTITGLLGHNGAGKSTTMSMLTGILEPSAGHIAVDGISFKDQWESYRKMVGYCPQQGILYDNLTTEEHISLYSSLKSKDSKGVKSNVNELVMKMSLQDKRSVLCKNLSEGLRRRLAIAIAFSGDSSVIILDEPTSGVDSVARRYIWDFITDCKEGKTIIITTHQMDEAEILCDDIAIIHKGKLLSTGSTLQLQEKYGNGLQLSINQGLHSGLTTEVTSVSSSRMSIASPSHINEDQIDLHVSRIVPSAEKITHSAQRRSYSLPVKEEKDYQKYHQLFAILENEKKSLDISTFSISSPNLEDIFMSMTAEADNTFQENIKSKHGLKFNKVSADSELESFSETESTFESELLITEKREFNAFSSFAALLTKRLKRLLGDKKILVTSYVIPTVLLVLAMVLGIIRPGTTSPPLLLTPSLYGPESLSFISNGQTNSVYSAIKNPPGIGTTCMKDFESVADFTHCMHQFREVSKEDMMFDTECSCIDTNWSCESNSTERKIQRELTNTTDILLELPQSLHPNQWILNSHYEYVEKQYGGWRFDENTSIVYYNNKGFHASASYLNALNNARLRSGLDTGQVAQDYGITTYSHPFRSNENQVLGQSILQHVSDYTLALLLLTAVSFVPASSIIYLIQERMNEEKLVLRTFKVGPILYWTSNLVWDLCITLIFLIISAAVIKIFGVRSFSEGPNFFATLALFLMYCLTINTFIYMIEKCFREPSFGQVIIFTGCIFSGVLTLMVMLLLYMYWWIKPLADAREFLITTLLIIPPYALGGGLLDLTTNQISADLFQQFTDEENSNYRNPFDWDIAGKNLCFLAIEMFIFFIANIIYEIIYDSNTTNSPEANETLSLENVSKTYSKCLNEFVAVKDTSLKVSKGECYGLIGLNGAGKSTTFKMITGQIRKTTGVIRFNCDRIGYCPQNNSLDDHITVQSHLQIYSRIAGYDSVEAQKVTELLMKEFTLEQYRSVPCGNLSGGNKRKVCTATSMLGNPKLILMDEPTSGMDPATRRLVWKNIGNAVKKGQSVLLTSHSLLECDTLCDNISIMVKGDIVCTGSPGMLREKYGQGYRVNVKMTNTSSVEDVHIYMSTNFNASKFIESKHNWMKYTVQGKISSLLGLLAMAKSLNIIDSFTIDVTSLEDIFLQITNASPLELGNHKKMPEEAESGWKVEGEPPEENDGVPQAADYEPPPLE